MEPDTQETAADTTGEVRAFSINGTLDKIANHPVLWGSFSHLEIMVKKHLRAVLGEPGYDLTTVVKVHDGYQNEHFYKFEAKSPTEAIIGVLGVMDRERDRRVSELRRELRQLGAPV